jgi:hypothetical protein
MAINQQAAREFCNTRAIISLFSWPNQDELIKQPCRFCRRFRISHMQINVLKFKKHFLLLFKKHFLLLSMMIDMFDSFIEDNCLKFNSSAQPSFDIDTIQAPRTLSL